METLFKDNRHTAIDKYPVSYGTGSIKIIRGNANQFLNSSIYRDVSTTVILQENIADDNLIKLREKFNSELHKFRHVSESKALSRFDYSLFFISKIHPEKITIEVTADESFYFSILKNDYSIYLEEYIDDGIVNVALFKNSIKQESFSGSIASVATKLYEILH